MTGPGRLLARNPGMRRVLALAAVVSACLMPAPAYADDEPLICFQTGAVYVTGVFYYDPPDPCLL